MLSILATTLALAGGCELVSGADVTNVSAPAVIVLGERFGTQPDLARATRVVAKLRKQAPVTLALQAVHRDKQKVLDRYAAGEIEARDLSTQLGWERMWAYPWPPYARLVGAASYGVEVLGVGTDGTPPDERESVPVPGGYISVLDDAMGGRPLPEELHGRFARTMAWTDYQIAERAVMRWSGKGYLVIVADRARVEGGKGIGWQLATLTQANVRSYLLATAHDTACYDGDKIWK